MCAQDESIGWSTEYRRADDATPWYSQCLGPGLEKQKIRNVSNQKVLPRLENVAKSQSNVAIEGHFMLLRVIQLLPKAEFHLNVATSHR